MTKIVLVLCLTIVVANLVFAVPEDFEEVLSQEVAEVLSYPKIFLTKEFFLDIYEDVEEETGVPKKCRHSLRRCNKEKKCCRNLRCGKIIKRCLPTLPIPKPTNLEEAL